MPHHDDPLATPPPVEVPLPNAPLVRVIAQVSFSPILSVEDAGFVAPFQEALREAYPILEQEEVPHLILHRDGGQPLQESRTAWRLTSEDGMWRASLNSDFIALETARYRSRGEFMKRTETLLEATAAHLKPAEVRRTGLRYVDRVTGQELKDIKELVRPEVLSMMGTPLFQHAAQALSEMTLGSSAPEEYIRARWGHVAAGNTIDPRAIEPVDESSWILDLDMFSLAPTPFDPMALSNALEHYSKKLYSLFRWFVTDEFLRRFGGNP